MATTKLAEIAEQLHQLARINRLGGIDTFFGRMELFESELGERHTALGLEWRRPGRYGNIIEYKPTVETIVFCFENGWTEKWIQSLIDWYKGQNTPDTAVLAVIMEIEVKKHASKKT